MKTYTLIITLFLFNIAYSQNNSVNNNLNTVKVQLKKGDTIHKKIILFFNNEALENHEYLRFRIDDFDWDNLTLLKNGIETTDEYFIVNANSNKEVISFDFFQKDNATSGVYRFNIMLDDQSNHLSGEGNIEYKNPKSKGFRMTTYVIPKTLMELIMSYSIIGVIFLLFLGLIIFILLKQKEFKYGILTFSHPVNDEVSLKRYKRKFIFKRIYKEEDTSVNFYLVKGKKGLPKVYAIDGCNIEFEDDFVSNPYQIEQRGIEIKIENDKDYVTFFYN